MKNLSILLLVLSFCITAFGQSGQEKSVVSAPTALINSDVIEMVKAGLSEAVILAKINSMASKFDTGIEALKLLKTEKIPESIVTRMIEASVHKDDNAKAAESSTEKPKLDKSEEYTAAEKIIGMLRRLDNAVEIGVTMQNYSAMLIESKSVLDENRTRVQSSELVSRADQAIYDHQYAASVWNMAASNGWVRFFTKTEPGRTLITKYKVPVKISLFTDIPVMTGLHYVWLSTRGHYNYARIAFEKISANPEAKP